MGTSSSRHGSCYEGDEGHEGRRCYDCHSSFWCSCRKVRIEEQGCEGCRHHIHGVGCFRVEEEWLIQVRWLPELEAEEEACHPCSQGCQPFHQGAMRVQSEASLQDCPCFGNEEVEGDGE